MARFSWVRVAAWAVYLAALVACSGGREEDYSCDDVTPCAAGAVCRDGLCVTMDQVLSASADVAGAATTVLVIDAAGNSCEASSCTNLPYGTQVTFRAGQPAGYRFTGWTGSEECFGTTIDLVIFNLSHDTHCTANYVRRVKIAGHASSAEGGVSAASDSPFATCNGGSCEVDAGQPVKLRADDRFGQRFTGWSGAGCGSATSFETTVSSTSADLVCIANFVERIVVRGTAMNAMAPIAVSSEGAVCEPGSCILDKGGNATLTAPVVPKFRFAGWSGTALCVGSDPVLRLSALSASQECLATYTPRVTVSGSSNGATPPPAVTALSPDLYASCTGSACDTDVGGAVTLLAGSAAGYRLTGWSGPLCEAERGPAVMLTGVSADAQCVANYLQGIAVIGAVVGAPGEVTATSSTEAAVCAEGGCVIDLGGNVTLTAPSPPGYRFLKWDGDEGCASEQRAVSFPQVTQSKTCYARFAERFLVRGTASPNEGGAVAASSMSVGATCENDGCTLDGGGEVALTASPRAGFRFSGWSGGGACTGTEPTVRVPNVQGNTTCQANFIGRFTVGAASAPPEGGTVAASSDSGAATCAGAMCQVDRGSRVSFTATAATGYRFVGWAGCSNVGTPTLTLDNITQDTSCTANFTPLRYTVTSGIAPTDSGSVQASANGGAAQCAGGQCTVNYGTDVALTATPAVGWRFGGWSGCTTSDQATVTLPAVKADTTCQATFQRITFSVSAAFTPDNGGAVTINATGVGASCAGLRCTVPYGGNAVLNANPGNGWSFGGWSGCSTSMDPALTLTNVTAEATCTANFTRQRFDVTGNVRPNASGTVAVSSSAQGATCNGNRCTVNYGSAVTLRASASPGFRFSNWTGCSNSNNAELTLPNVTANTTCQANFERLRFTVTGTAGAGGSVRASANGGDCTGDHCTVDYGGTVALTPNPSTGYRFVGWTSCPVMGDAAINIANVTDNVTCQANFAPLRFTVTGNAGMGGVVVAAAQGGDCAGDHCTVNYGGTVALTAMPITGFQFAGWSNCPVMGDAMIAIPNVTANVTCQANFAALTFPVRGSAAPTDGGAITVAGTTPGATCTGAACTVPFGGAVTFAAAANPGFDLMGWTGCAVDPANPARATVSNVTMAGSCVANFTRRAYRVAGEAGAGGSISGATTTDGGCQGAICTVNHGGSATFTASVDVNGGYELAGWSGCTPLANDPLRATVANVTAPATCSASFRLRTHTVSLAVPNGSISSLSAPGGSCAGSACTVPHGGSATFVVAASNASYEFDRWTGGCVQSPNNPLQATASNVTADVSCTASFRLRSFTVTARSSTGTVAASANGVACPNNACNVPSGTSVRMTASSQTNVRFAGWMCSNGLNSVASTIDVTADANIDCTATFAAQVTVNTRVGDPATGSASVSGGSPACAAGTSCTVDAGSTVTLTATPARGYVFASWVGCNVASATAASTTLMATGNATCGATFNSTTPPDVVITGAVSPATAGSIQLSTPVGPTGAPAGSCVAGGPAQCTVPSGGGVTLAVTIPGGSTLSSFTGCAPEYVGQVVLGAATVRQYVLSGVTASTTCQANLTVRQTVPPTVTPPTTNLPPVLTN
ncbi:MAG TPA: InlB B-repeat-containing protein [Polyangiales bacterium]